MSLSVPIGGRNANCARCILLVTSHRLLYDKRDFRTGVVKFSMDDIIAHLWKDCVQFTSELDLGNTCTSVSLVNNFQSQLMGKRSCQMYQCQTFLKMYDELIRESRNSICKFVSFLFCRKTK